MGTATDLAVKAAEPFLRGDQLSALVVALAVALVVISAFSWWELKRKDERIYKLLVDWRLDTVASRESVTTALKTVDAVLQASAKGRR